MVVTIADVLAGIIGVGIIAIGIRFLLQPQASADGFGVKVLPGQGVRGYLSVKGVRDIVSGLVPLGLLIFASAHTLGLVMVIEAVTPIGDGAIVLANKGLLSIKSRLAIAFGVHWATAVVCVLSGVMLLAS